MLNQVVLQGRIGRDPELRYTGTNTPVVSFVVAVERDYAKDGNRETDWIEIVAWNSTAEFVSKHFQKGDMINVTGRLQIREWTDKEGNKRKVAEVVADKAYFGGKKSGAAEKSDRSNSAPPAEAYAELPDDEELPF